MKVYINGVQYKADSNWTITEKVGNPTMSTFNVLVENQAIPTAGDVITVKDDNNNNIFFGLVGIPKSPVYSSPYQPKIYNLNCTNGNSVLSRRIANESFSNKTITEVVQYLYQKYISAEGITLGSISLIPTPVFEIYNCKNMNLMAVMNELAGYVNGAWQITNDKVFNFVINTDFPNCSQVATTGTDSFSIQRQDSEKDLRTNQIIDGSYLRTDEQTEQVTVSADWQGFLTSFAVIEKPKIYINGVQVPDNEIGIRGISQQDTTTLFFWGYNERQILLNANYWGQTNVEEGDIITIEYYGIAPIRYSVTNDEKVSEIRQKTGLSGVIDNVYTDSTIVTKTDVENKANSLLELHGQEQNTITLYTDLQSSLDAGYLVTDFDLYTEWTFNLSAYGISGSYILTEKKTTPLVFDDDASIQMTLTFTDRNFIRSYAETISKLYFDVTKLSIREDETIISEIEISEETDLEEEVGVGTRISLYVASSMQNGQIAQPLGTIDPYLCYGGGSAWNNPFALYAGADNFVPCLIGSGIEVACK